MSRRHVAGPLALAAVLFGWVGCVSACGGTAGTGRTTPTPSPLSPDAAQLKALAATSRDSLFSATYAATAGARTAQVAVFLASATRYRVDFTEGGITASLYGTAAGSVACSIAPGVAPVCFLVGAPGKAVPARYDAGVEQVFTRDLPGLSASPGAFTVQEQNAEPAAGALPAARCFVVSGRQHGMPLTSGQLADVDLGTYCLSASGPPRSLTFASGSLTLTSVGAAPTPAQLTPPATPRPLPTTSPTVSPSASPTTPFGVLNQLAEPAATATHTP